MPEDLPTPKKSLKELNKYNDEIIKKWYNVVGDKMITIKSEREIELMRHAGMLVSEMHKFIKPYIKEGISTYELDKLCEEFILKNDGVCSCKGYEGYPATLCTSINDVVVHGIPHKEDILHNGHRYILGCLF